MICKSVQFKVQSGKVDTAKAAIAEFIKHIKKGEPDTIYYDCYQDKNDPQKFMHMMAFKDSAAEELHATSNYCKAFTEILYPISIEGPEFREFKPVT